MYKHNTYTKYFTLHRSKIKKIISNGLYRIAIRQSHLRQNYHGFRWIIVIFALFAIEIFKECMIKSRNSNCLYNYKLSFNASKCYRKNLPSLRNINDISKFRGIHFQIFYILIFLYFLYTGSPWSTLYTSCCVDYFYILFLLKTKNWIIFKMLLPHEKQKKRDRR